ncbi:MAG TPA: hypothetical protein VN017_02390 [Pseudoxanthomonas sp.]|jgi:hypothetical protein|uniref:hypothetical protein n=1 Tax=unclassified Massilia TaxID=2609279 RepID=UPI0006FC2773|nr:MULTISPECIES: hypothetical protein [unclassified Massilia]KQX96978.1 hypothetical protein ASD28_18040 [Massilia sp. Root133]KQZ52683.1 hypothetical protein ASD92_19460 [Massilia sp. Root1485]HWU70190.1 hypothetical protein [Pseudoxanthomonas sp.]
MNRIVPPILAATAILLSGCAADGAKPAQGGNTYLDSSYTPTGTLIPRKAPSRTDNLTIVDKQALENDRTNGSGTNNWAAGKP